MQAFTDTVITKEEMVRKFLIKKGFSVSGISKKDNSNGLDVVAIKNNEYFTIEVKSIVQSSRACVVKKIQKSGKSCDYIAIVTPSGNIIFQEMKDHIKLCNNGGTRSITKLVRLYDCF